MSDVLILDLGAVIKGNCQINGYADKVILLSYSHGVHLPMSNDHANTERTAGRPSFTEMSFAKEADLATTEMYKACTQGTKVGTAKLHVGRVENGVYMPFFTYEFTNAMISSMTTSGGAGGGRPQDSFTLNFTAIKCDYTKQKADSSQAGTATWNWSLETMKST